MLLGPLRSEQGAFQKGPPEGGRVVRLSTGSLSLLGHGCLVGCSLCTFAQLELVLAASEKDLGQKAEDAGHTLEVNSCEQE